MTRLGALLALGALLSAPGCGQSGRGSPEALAPARFGASTAARAVGCWELEWTVSGGVPGTAMIAMPDSVQLRDGVLFGTLERLVSPATHPSGRQARDGPSTGEPDPWEARFRVNRWWVEEQSVRIRFSDGEAEGWNVWLEFEEEGLGGGAARGPVEDVADQEASAGVNARRISCDIG